MSRSLVKMEMKPDGSQPSQDGVVPEAVDLEDPVDRAMRKRKGVAVRVNPKRIGFYPGNRGSTGVCSRHIHEIVEDCMKNKIRLGRYEPVELMELTEPLLKKFKAQNKAKCETDPLMPRYSPDMEYVAIGRNHFTHACKLFQDGDHTLFGKPDGLPIRLRKGDTEGAEILKHGVSAMVYKAELWSDLDAVHAIASIGNLNSKIDASEDEMQAFGRIDDLYDQMSNDAEWRDAAQGDGIPVQAVLDALKNQSGLGHFVVEDWSYLIALRQVVSKAHSDILKMCQFNAVGSQIRLRCSCFEAVANLDRRCPMVKVSLLLFQYLASAEAHGKAATNKDDNTFDVVFAGRKSTYAKNITPTLLFELRAEVKFLQRCEKDILCSLMHYGVADVDASFGDSDRACHALLTARGAFLSKAGKMILRLMGPFQEATLKKKIQKKTLSPEQRDELFEKMELDNQLAKLETQFREILLKERVFTEISLPTRRTIEKADDVACSLDNPKQKQEKAKRQDGNAGVLKQTMSANCLQDGIEHTFSLNEQDIFSRLSIRGLNEQVMAYIDTDNDTVVSNVKQEMPDSENEGQPEEEQCFRVASWHKGILRSLDLPSARVEVILEFKSSNQTKVKKKTRTFVVNQDQLQAAEPEVTPPPTRLHPTLQEPGALMESYDVSSLETQILHAAVSLLLSDAARATRSFASRVEVFRQSKEGELPVSLQCRALETFKRGELVLVPGCVTVDWAMANSDDESAAENPGPTKKPTIHRSMVPRVRGRIQEVVKDGRRHCADGPQTTFDLMSPFVVAPLKKGDEVKTSEAHPFWAVIRCLNSKSAHNMKLTVEDYALDQTIFKGCQKPNKQTLIGLPVLRNIAPIQKGDILTVPYMREAGDED